MKKIMILIALALAACAPQPTHQPAPPPPMIYMGSPINIFNTVVSLIAADFGIPAYNMPDLTRSAGASGPWEITSRDMERGFITAQATSPEVALTGDPTGRIAEVHTITVVMNELNTNPPRTQVIFSTSDRARALEERIHRELRNRFGIAEY